MIVYKLAISSRELWGVFLFLGGRWGGRWGVLVALNQWTWFKSPSNRLTQHYIETVGGAQNENIRQRKGRKWAHCLMKALTNRRAGTFDFTHSATKIVVTLWSRPPFCSCQICTFDEHSRLGQNLESLVMNSEIGQCCAYKMDDIEKGTKKSQDNHWGPKASQCSLESM